MELLNKVVEDGGVEKLFAAKGLAEVATVFPKTMVVPNYVVLGQLVALRFFEWVSAHPDGVIALPTGRTPEYFIKWARYYLKNWEREAKSGLLAHLPHMHRKPEMQHLRFVQLDEFFPIP